MDRHDLHEESAADVANAHAKDLEVQETYGVSFLSYWFDEASGSAFCLARAPGAEDMEAVHRESMASSPTRSFPSQKMPSVSSSELFAIPRTSPR